MIPVAPNWNKSAWINKSRYDEMYERSLHQNDQFWDQVAERLTWYQRWTKTKSVSFDNPVHIEWYRGGKLNVSYNCIDRHLPQHKDRVAFYWEPEDPKAKS